MLNRATDLNLNCVSPPRSRSCFRKAHRPKTEASNKSFLDLDGVRHSVEVEVKDYDAGRHVAENSIFGKFSPIGHRAISGTLPRMILTRVALATDAIFSPGV
jgi:hypothetical protein